MFLLIVASIHLYLMRRMKTKPLRDHSSHHGTTYQTKRAMLSPMYWQTAQRLYQRLTTYVFSKVFIIALPLTVIDIWLLLSYRTGIILVLEVFIYLLLLAFIYGFIEHKLKHLQ